MIPSWRKPTFASFGTFNRSPLVLLGCHEDAPGGDRIVGEPNRRDRHSGLDSVLAPYLDRDRRVAPRLHFERFAVRNRRRDRVRTESIGDPSRRACTCKTSLSSFFALKTK